MKTMRFLAALLSACALLAMPGGMAVAQVRIEGQTFEAQVRLADAELRLNGVGLRATAWIKGYAAGLYLRRKTASAAEVLAMPGPKRLQMRMLLDVPADEFVKAFEKGVTRNTPAGDLPGLRDRMQQFDRLISGIGKVRKGDVVDLDFVPERGLVLSLNGKPRGEAIPGEDLYAGLLRIFIGERPADRELKTGLLGGPAT